MPDRSNVIAEVKHIFADRLVETEERSSILEESSLEEVVAGAHDEASLIPPGMAPDRVVDDLDLALTERRGSRRERWAPEDPGGTGARDHGLVGTWPGGHCPAGGTAGRVHPER